jgi:AcrR family transcriptional regulator
MVRYTDDQREARRQRILAAALRCFSRNGFHNTTTADIVREADVSQGTFYLYFLSKEDVIAALADDRNQGRALLNAIAQAEHDPVAGLSLLLEVHGRFLTDPEHEDARRVSIQGWAEALRNASVHERLTANIEAIGAQITQLIERGQRSGQLSADVDAAAMAHTLIALFQGLTLYSALGRSVDLCAINGIAGDMIRMALLPAHDRGTPARGAQ